MTGRNGQRQRQTQIPFGNDKQRGNSKSNGNGNSNGNGKRRFPSGMTNKGQQQTQTQTQIPFGNDKQRGTSDGNSNSKGNMTSRNGNGTTSVGLTIVVGAG